MQAEVCNTATQVGIGSGGFPGQFLFGNDREFIWESVSVGHWGPAFIRVSERLKRNCASRRRRLWFGAGNGHLDRLIL